MTLGEKLRELRRKKDLSQTELGKLINIHYTHIGKYENDQQIPSTDTVKKIAEVFEVSIDYLLEENPESTVKVSFQDEDLLRQFKEIENMPDSDKNVIKELINAFMIKNKIKHLVG